jgi:hypothetical protein
MNFDSLIETLNHKLLQIEHRPLNYAETLILQGIWQYRTYNQIAQEGGYSAGYLTNVVAPELCRRLSELMGRRVTKKNCRVLLESYVATSETIPRRQSSESFYPQANQEMIPRFPSGAVPLDSPYYIEQSGIQTEIYEEIRKTGALIRIKAPKEMGKTSLLLRILEYANCQGYRTVNLNLAQIDQTILSDVNRFLRWLCANIALQLQLEAKIDEYWDEDIGSKVSCTYYLQSYLLKQINSPVVLAFDEVNQTFDYPHVAKDFFLLLRSLYEETKRSPLLQKLRLIVVHSTEADIHPQIHRSPFNVGLPIQLTDFSLDQIQQLAQRYGLDWTDGEEARQLMKMVGGHPALVNIALYHLHRGNLTLAQLLDTAPTSDGIYSHHLQRHWAVLQAQAELAIALQIVINAQDPVLLEPILAHKLSSMGLIKLNNNKATPSCQLYRLYFQKKLLPAEQQILVAKK